MRRDNSASSILALRIVAHSHCGFILVDYTLVLYLGEINPCPVSIATSLSKGQAPNHLTRISLIVGENLLEPPFRVGLYFVVWEIDTPSLLALSALAGGISNEI
jgi:hypothetical protein